MKKLLAVFLLLTAIYLLPAPNSFAQYGGETPSYSIIIDKTVAKPATGDYVDNLSPSDPRFAPSQDVWFRVKVKNTSERDITNVQVRDFVPDYLEPVEGPGAWDASTRIISWNAGDFKVDEEKVYFLKMRVHPQANLPADKGLFCIVNKADVRSSGPADDDFSQLCIEKQVKEVKKVPSAGPEMGILLLSGEFSILSLGLFLKRKFR